jgi:hypothetical protein
MRTTEQQTRGDDQPDIDTMRYDIAEREAMNMPVSNMIDILIYGCEALEDMPDIEVRDEWNMLFGESEKDVDKD